MDKKPALKEQMPGAASTAAVLRNIFGGAFDQAMRTASSGQGEAVVYDGAAGKVWGPGVQLYTKWDTPARQSGVMTWPRMSEAVTLQITAALGGGMYAAALLSEVRHGAH